MSTDPRAVVEVGSDSYTPGTDMEHQVTSASALSAIVVGGSIGGLTAAVVLRDAGFEVTVLERSTAALEGRGAGIVLHETTARYLVENAGMSLDAISEGARWFRFIDRTGTVTHQEPCRYRFTAWNTLYTSLLRHLPPDRYRLGQEVTRLEQSDEQVQVFTADGSSLTGDLVVCGDGVTSTSRQHLLPGVESRYAGYLGWRGVVLESELDPEAFGRLYEAITYSTPPLSHILAYPIPSQGNRAAERVINYVWYRNLEEGPALDDALTDIAGTRRTMSVAPGMVQDRHISALHEEARAVLPDDLARMVLRTEEPFIQTVVDVEVPRAVFGRVCLIGDAAFAVRPHAAAGTAKAAADAWSLAAALESNRDVVAALEAWEPVVLERGRRLIERARRLGNMAQVEGSFVGGDPYIMFGLDRPGDSCYPEPDERN